MHSLFLSLSECRNYYLKICFSSLQSLAIASLVLGIFSHFDSDWARKTEHVDGSYFRPYELCYNWGWLFEHGPRCPIIIWEYFFVATVIAAFCWSVGTLVAGILLRERSTKLLRGFVSSNW